MANCRPRILFVGAFPQDERPIYGGIVSSCSALLTSELPKHAEFILLDSTQASNPPPSFQIRLRLAIRRFFKFCKRIISERPDATLIFMSAGASIVEKGLMGWFARACKVPVLFFPRAGSVIDASPRLAMSRLILRVLLRPATVLLCQSEVWRQFACSNLGIARDRTLVIENWTATPGFLAVGSRRHEIVRSNDTFRIVYVGWVEKEKGIFDLLRACDGLVEKGNFEVQIVGDGTAMAEAKQLVRASGLIARVRFLGWLSHPALRSVLENADAFVHPSWSEGFPNALIEAMAARLPVVVTRVGGIPGVIQDRISGLLVEPRSPTALRAAMCTLMENPDLRKSVADAGYVLAAERFSASAAVKNFRKAFEMALR